ncbi:MAG: hypothetical protein ACO3YO_02930 [Chthoniobacterales bacterium]
MLTTLRQRVRRVCAAIGREVFANSVISLHRRPARSEEDPSVHMLVSSRTWHAGLLAAVSWEHHSGRRWRFFIHEDGTLDNEARNRIRAVLPDVRLVPRDESDEKLQIVLQNHPRCLAQRTQHNLFLKFTDFAAFAPGPRFLVLDSDVIFFRPPTEVLEWVDGGSDTYHYNEDTKEKFCIPRPYLEEALGVTMWPRFNSGLVLAPKAAIDWELAERLLSVFEQTAHHPQFFEQTLYALMGSAWGRGGALPRTYEISWGYFRHRGAVCRHYVGAFKHDLLYIEGAPLTLAAMLKKRAGV